MLRADRQQAVAVAKAVMVEQELMPLAALRPELELARL
jgi:ABC-type arginine transport system ATPase subunit